MKTREASIPEGAVWDTFFDPSVALEKLGLAPHCKHVADFACGHGTFAVPAERIISGKVIAIDIDPVMVEGVRARAEREDVGNVEPTVRDLVEDGSGLPDISTDYVMLFNILHAEDPMGLLKEAHRILVRGGSVGIIHWNHEPSTPRGPSMDIRPRPQQCLAWAVAIGFRMDETGVTDLPPYHYGFRARKI